MALTAAAQGHGARIRRPLTVAAVEVRHDDLVHVHTSTEVIAARRAVVTVGAWTAGLLGGVVDLPPLRVTQEQQALFPFHDVPPCVARPGAWPTFIHHGPGAFGLADPCGDVKIGLRGTGIDCDPDRNASAPAPAGLALLQDHVATWLPGLDATRPRPVTCIDTVTAGGELVLERHGPLVVGTGSSSHGFAHAPVAGETIASLADSGVPAPVRG